MGPTGANSRINVAQVELLGHRISPEGRSPNLNGFAALIDVHMTRDVPRPRSLSGDLSCDRQYLRNLAQTPHTRVILLRMEMEAAFTVEME